jgi:hypothetical protein
VGVVTAGSIAFGLFIALPCSRPWSRSEGNRRYN